MIKRVCFVGLLVIAAVLVQDAAAGLPYSTYGAETGWQGSTTYQQDGLSVMISFNVYDVVAHPGEFVWADVGVEMPSTDRYIYAYQVIAATGNTKDIASFSVGDPNAKEVMHSTCAQTDYDSAPMDVMPDPNVSEEQGVWEWSPFLPKSGFSSRLIFSSNKAPTKGSFEVQASESVPPVPGHNPEPGTIALLGVGSGLFAARRRQKRQGG